MRYLPLLIVSLILFGCNPKQKEELKQTPLSFSERAEWELLRLADPQTGEIPPNIRARELKFAQSLPTDNQLFRKKTSDWKQIGPYNIGGRTGLLQLM